MTTPSKTAVLERLLPLIEAFALARLEMRQLRREMRAKECTGRSADEPGPCYHPTDGRSPWCDNCREHDATFHRLLQVRQRQAKRMQQIERLAIKYAMPEPEIPPEPKLLLELIDRS
jgi:hypothetical protein